MYMYINVPSVSQKETSYQMSYIAVIIEKGLQVAFSYGENVHGLLYTTTFQKEND